MIGLTLYQEGKTERAIQALRDLSSPRARVIREESLSLGLMVCVVIGLTLYQEGKTERAIQALRDLSSPRARVIREPASRRRSKRPSLRPSLKASR
ncbi:hypothetical protein [Mycobacterium tuberculosis]|uniref:hypothetical protein n=1 Tax=Mycobacterium tuberculosis TaxID=1773 RepID=UPI00272B7BEB|nr:hypothetical protein [Mycobacterium tuberculosis]